VFRVENVAESIRSYDVCNVVQARPVKMRMQRNVRDKWE
jgi:hypothetical protein